ncbi:MAG: dihydroorotate dehydrogenase-like protein [Candidatus Aminicenantes bacterium]|nr:dihydroorotate dehydrogenase-like protein [Candidatus Aminicenantes bacterium]
MADLTTGYMGLTLKNPVIIGSCGLTHSVKEIKKLESHGAAAVVLKSIFEEQISMDSDALSSDFHTHSEEADYLRNYTKQHTLDKYLELIKEVKKEVGIPVIASINCASAAQWVSFGKAVQDAGADGLELNIFIMPAGIKEKGGNIEKIYFDIINEVKKHISIPLAVKMGFYFSGLANTIFELSLRGIAGIVLFNRFYRPDIDLKSEKLTTADIFSTPDEIYLPLRWVGMMSSEVKCDLTASTGIHDGFGVVKCLLAGAKAVQVASIIYQKGAEHIGVMLNQVQEWMKEHNYSSIKDFNGKLAQENIKNPQLYERAQFMKYYANASST